MDGTVEPVFLIYTGGIKDFCLCLAVGGTVDFDLVARELAVVLVGSDHVGLKPLLFGLQGECADDIVGFISLHLKDGNVESADDILDDGDGLGDTLRLLLALRFVGGICLVPECGTLWVKSDGNVGGMALVEELCQRVDKSKDGGGVEAFGVYSLRIHKCVEGAINQRVSIEQIQFVHS